MAKAQPSQQDLHQIRQMIFSGTSSSSIQKSSTDDVHSKSKDGNASRQASTSMANLSSTMNQYRIDGHQNKVCKSSSRMGSRMASPSGSRRGSKSNLYAEIDRINQNNFLEVSLPAAAFKKLSMANNGVSKSLRGSRVNLASGSASVAGSQINLADTKKGSIMVTDVRTRRGSNAPNACNSVSNSRRGSFSGSNFPAAIQKSLNGSTVPFDNGHFETLKSFASHVKVIRPEHFVGIGSKGTHGFEEITAVLSNAEYPAHNDDRVFRVKKVTKEDVQKANYVSKLQALKEKAHQVKYVFCSSLLAVVQDTTCLYFVSDCHIYTLQEVLNNNTRRLTEPVAKFYFAEIILGLEYLHNQDIIYGDLNPENIYVTDLGHIKIVDPVFQHGLRGIKAKKDTVSVGSPGYVAPEVLHLKTFSRSADFWSLGCLLYELLFGQTPFPRDSKQPLYEEMAKSTIENSGSKNTFLNFPDHERKVTSQVKELISRLLIISPKERLGSWHGASDIKCHPWLSDLPRWKAIEDLQVTPPFIPDAPDLQTWSELEAKRNKGRELILSAEPNPVTPSKEMDRLCFIIEPK